MARSSDSSSPIYLTLPSNASLNFYPENTLANYTVKLDPPVQLQGPHEVGLSEICYPRSWVTAKDGELLLKISVVSDVSPIPRVVSIPGGQYRNIGEIVQALQVRVSSSFSDALKLEYDEVSRKTTITVPRFCCVEMTDMLRDILGFKENTIEGRVMRSERTADIGRGLTALYVYASLVQERIVGDVKAPLLRLVPVKGQHGDVVFKTYQNIHFLPVAYNSFDSITINIRNGAGELIPFEGGQVIVTLQLRPRPYA